MSQDLRGRTFCWLLERRDGAGVALTSHDRALAIDGIRYEPSPGMMPAAIRTELGLEPNSTEIAGSLTSAAVSVAVMAAGRWDGASLRLFAVDWAAPGAGNEPLLEGELGPVSGTDCRFQAELLGVAARLERACCPLTSPECRAELGDRQCRIDLAGRKLRARVTNCDGNLVEIDMPVDERFRFGQLRFLAGTANGERRIILSASGHQLILRSAPAGAVGAGVPVELLEGCDKRLATCSARFGNAANFRGEPHLPGNDLLTRYPGS